MLLVVGWEDEVSSDVEFSIIERSGWDPAFKTIIFVCDKQSTVSPSVLLILIRIMRYTT